MDIKGNNRTASTDDALRDELLRNRLSGRKSRPGHSGIERADRTVPLPLSYGQQQMWFLNRLAPDSPEYSVPLTLRMRGPLDAEVFGAAWAHVCDRHEVLRTRYVLNGTEPEQVVDPAGASPLPLIDLTDLPLGERESRAVDLVARQAAAPFALEKDWPVHGALIRLADDDHVLAIVFHHIACDAWSTRIFGSELTAAYRAFSKGESSPLPPLSLQYADYAAWQRRELAGPSLERHLGYWRRQLADTLPIDLPADYPRPAVRDYRGDEVRFAVRQEVADGVRELARRHRTTPFVVFLTAYQVLLSRYLNQTDICVGTVISGRTRPELQQMIGYGINSLVLRAHWDGDPTFADLVDRARGTVLEAFDHQEVPFARLVDELEPERDMSRTPLYQVGFTMHEWRTDAFEFDAVTAEPFGSVGGIAKCDLTLQVEEGPQGDFNGRLEYATSLFGHDTVERFMRHLLGLLDDAIVDPGKRVSRLEFMDAAERAVVGGALDGYRLGAPVQRCVHEVFAERVAASPDAVAVVAGAVELSYAELDARANQLARYLREIGVGPEDLVGVCLERDADLIPSLLGVLKAGAGYVPLDPVNPAERLNYVLADSGARVVVTTRELAGLFDGLAVDRVVVLDGVDAAGIAACAPVAPVVAMSPENLVYVIYTSGSTGRPKGVQVTHANVVRLMESARAHIGFGEADVWSMFHSYAFDVSVFEMWGALLHGGRLVVVPRDVARSSEEFVDLLVDQQVTMLSQTPSAFRSLVAAAAADDPRIGQSAQRRHPQHPRLALRAVIFAGEKLETAELAPWVQRCGLEAPALVNMYGITETTVHSTFYRVTDEDLVMHAPSRVGYPISDLRIHLLDGWGNVVPVGVPGEIYVGGPGVTRGYLGRAGLTAERFVPDPFGPVGERLYRSGDLARRREDGSLEFMGRIDDQVKIRGYRIELGEIEAALAGQDTVRDAVVVVREDRPGDRQLVAYVTPAGGSLDVAVLRSGLGRVLPDYMVPAAIVVVDALPLTPNGKLDKRALPAPDLAALVADVFVAPRTPVEEQVAKVWQQVLGVSRVGVHDSFFDLGGDSIRAVGLVGALREAGYDVTVGDVFAYRTVAALGELITGRPVMADADHRVQPFELITSEDRQRLPQGVVDAYPVSQAQLGMLVEMMAEKGRNSYHNVCTFRILDEKPFDFSAFQGAVRLVVTRHDVLRTSFDLTGYSRPLQLVHESADLSIGMQMLTGLDEESVRRELHEFTARERADLFDIGVPSLLRYFAHVTDDGGWWLSVTECHPVLEGWSYHSLQMEILRCYLRLRDGLEPEPYEAPSVRFADSIAGELESLDSDDDRAYWQHVLDEHTKFTLPGDWGDTSSSGDGENYKVAVSWKDLEHDLRSLATAAKVSLKSVMLAAHMKVMSQLTGESAFHTGLVCDARPEAVGADRVYGMYLNTLPFPVDRSARTWRELVQQVFAREAAMWPHRRYPLPAIQRLAYTGQRLLDVLFNYQDFRQVDGELVDHDGVIDASPTELPLTVASRSGHIILTADPRFIARAHAERISGMYRAVLESMATGLDGDARAVYLPEGEYEGLLEAAYGSGHVADRVSSPVLHCVHEVFAERVAASPDAVAVVADGVELSYAEVDARANRLAQYLRGLGVGPEDLVGVCLERGVELVPSLLGVLQAGAGYVPLDPVNPAERLSYVLADSGARVVVTTRGLAALFDEAAVDRVVVLDGIDETGIAACESVAPAVAMSPDNVVYVIYTSGSTGRPKGVQISHANVVRLMESVRTHIDFGAADVWTMFHSYAFDFSVYEMWGALLYGGRVVVVPGAVARSSDEFVDLLVEQQVTMLSQTASAFRSLVAAADSGDPRIDRLALRAVVFGGERLEMGDLAPWVQRCGLEAPALVNMYGITETTVHVTFYRITAEDIRAHAPSRMGYPISDLRVHLLDGWGNVVPVGVPGEIYVGGPGVTRGYLGRAGLTAERFVPDPFGAPGERLYRSGDLARRREDGSLEFVGRIDDQVKIRGYRIELGEIEAALAGQDTVRDAVVLVREDRPGNRQLVAYVTPAIGEGVDVAVLRPALGRVLPDYMVPAAIVVVDALPLTPNGKLDKRALPAPDLGAFAAEVFVAPRTPVEEQVAKVWQQVLGVSRVGVHDSFFDLGGDSIRAVGLVGALREAGYDVTVGDVFAYRTVAALGELITGRPVMAGVDRRVRPFELITSEDRQRLPQDVVDAYPVSQAQLGMLVEFLADEEHTIYHSVTSFFIRDEQPFDFAALRTAVRLVVARHDVLRTSFDLTGYSQPLQLVHAGAEIPCAFSDLSDMDEHEQKQAVDAFVAAERKDAFDLTSSASLWRVAIHVHGEHGWRCTFTQHHAILEGWSYHHLLMEIVDCYRRLRDGLEPEPYEAPSVRFADSVAAEVRALESAETRAYWHDLVGRYSKFTLPVGWNGDRSVPAVKVGAIFSFRDLLDDLRSFASRAEVPLKSVLLAAHLKVMSQLTVEPAFHTGVVSHTRLEEKGADRVYGMHLNTLPFPMDGTARTWRELAHQAFEREVEQWPNRHFPMPEIQRDNGGGRLIDVFFSYLDFHNVDTDLIDEKAGITVTSDEFSLAVGAVGDVLSVRSNSHILSQANAERISGMFRAVLESMAADLDGDARAVHLPEGEYERLLAPGHIAAATDDSAAPTVMRCVHEVFAERVAASPDAVAVVAGAVELSYAELDARANRLAQYLRGLGVGPEDLVGVCLERDADLVSSLLGVLKAGAGYVPLDPVNPAERLNYVLTDSGARVVVTTRELSGLFGETTVDRLVVLDGADETGIAACESVSPAAAISPDNVVYVIYTSGSTGRPKGVQVSHANVVRFAESVRTHIGFDASDVWTMFHSYAFDTSVFEMWGALLHGGRLVVVPREVSRSSEEFMDLLVDQRVTMLIQTPSAFGSLVAAARAGDPRIDRLALRAVIFGGERLEMGDLGPWAQRCGLDTPVLVNMYGITETTVVSTLHSVTVDDVFYQATADDVRAHAASRVGHPMSGLRIHLLDRWGNVVPVGVTGEIYVGGPGVARGYLGRPMLTAERFVPDPFGAPGERLYRSGDLARRREDGSLEFVGRIDDQVKIRGYRIELGEIEAALAGQDTVSDVAVLVREDKPGERQLVAYMTSATGAGVDVAGLRSALGRVLPDYMVPAAIVVMDALPLTSNGKLDKRALPAPDRGAFAGGAFVAPRTPVEEQVAKVWQQVLGVSRVGVHDSFFDLGGDSIRAVGLVGALREAGYDVTVRDVFAGRTIAALGELITGRPAMAGADHRVEPFELITSDDRQRLPHDVVDAYPVSQAQLGMLVEILANEEHGVYHSVGVFRVRDEFPFAATALRAALSIVAARHDALRTSFHLTGYSQPLQLVHADAEIPLVVHDLRHLDQGRRRTALDDFIAAERADTFDHAQAPLLRVAAVLDSDDDSGWWLSFAAPHTIGEGWSARVLMLEILGCYRRLRDGLEPEPYESPSVRFADFVAGELESLASATDRGYWQHILDEHAPLDLPATWHDNADAAGERFFVRVPVEDLEARLRAVAAECEVSLKSVMLAVHMKVMSQLTGEAAFHTGLVCDARPEALGAERVYGMSLNTLPFPMDRTARTWRELVQQVFAREVAMWPHRRYPLPAIARLARTGQRLLDVLFNFQDFHLLDDQEIDTEASLGGGTTEFGLEVYARRPGFLLKANPRAFSRDSADRLARMYLMAVQQMARDIDGDARVSLLPDADRQSLLVEWSGTARQPDHVCVVEEFERHAAVTPSAVAVVADDESLTYAQVNDRANRMAHHLREQGVGPDTVVGMCILRSPDLLVAILAVLKAGGAYLALDPSHPADRLAYMTEDSNLLVMLVQRQLLPMLPTTSAAHVVVDEPGRWDELPAHNPTRVADPDNLAYVMYTSGSTGRPKGVLVPRRGMGNHLLSKIEDLGLTRSDSVVQNASITFDISVWQLLAPLVVGGRVRVVDADTALDPQELFDRVAAERVTVLEVVPSLLRVALDSWDSGTRVPELPGMRRLVVTGEALAPDVCRRWLERYPHVPVVNAYGPTECSDDVTTAVIADPHEVGDIRVTIGRAIRNTRLYVLDEWLEPVPIGVPGELYVGGTGVTRGYHGRSGLTADRFLPDPFGPAGSRLYRTGDRVFCQADGRLEFLGRVDHQVKIRGVRIEPEEIEAALVERSDVAEAVVVVHEGASGAKQLVAYLVLADGHREWDSARLRADLARVLPPAMVPAVFMALDRFPLTLNGKLDRRALPAPDPAQSREGRYVAPRTAVEDKVAAVWQQVLEVPRIGVHDSFFEVGGDSLRAVNLVGSLRGAGFDVAVRDVLEYRTVEDLSAVLATRAVPSDRAEQPTTEEI
ncbi:amino acid adenylation domain-containing protein [Nocardia terpenica]|uniref:amino acid adenylation domain-containing protein n=1 Tax=Nocardia terpenica TaxID=455432 RepID=UPI002FE2793F